MLYINGTTIKLTRGDTAYLSVPIKRDGEDYTMQPTDTLAFSVKRYTTDDEYLIHKEVKGDNLFHIEPQDTADLPFGSYKYDVQLTTASGDVFTVIDVSTFEVLQEVTR